MTQLKDGNKIQIKRILVSQPEPSDKNSPYHKLAERYRLSIDFRPFIKIEAIPFKQFRKKKINVLDYTAIVFTSRNAIDHFFKICDESKVEMPAGMKYFCISEQTANYLQKYIVVRKRKLFVGKKTTDDILEIIKNHKKEKFLYPCSDIRKDDIPEFLESNNYKFSEVTIYKTVASDLSDLAGVNYDIIAFFSPSGINSLKMNFPEFKQNATKIAAFGATTANAVKEAGFRLDIEAPKPNVQSMIKAIELYIKEGNK